MPDTLRTNDVAEILGVSRQHVHRLDRALLPRRSEDGIRHYDPETIAAVAAERALRRAARGQR